MHKQKTPLMGGILASILYLQFKMLPQQLGQTTNQDKTLVVLGKTFIGLIVSNDTEHVITARSIHQHYFRPRLTDFPLFGRRLNCGRDLRKGLVVPVNAGQVPVYVGAG